MALIQKLISADKYNIKCPYAMTPKGICVHNTANDASAKNEVAYMQNNNNEVSFHIAIDDIESIQAIPFNRNAWATGDGGNGEGNRNYIHVEICYSLSGGERFANAEKRATKEIAILLKQYRWTIANVKKHQDFSAKYCPHRTLDLGWQRFLNMVQTELNLLNNQKEVKKVKNIVIYSNDVDKRAAEYLADFLSCPTISNRQTFDFSTVENVYAVGGSIKDFTSYLKQENFLVGKDRYETLKTVLKFMKKI